MEPRVLFFRSELFFVSQPFAAPVDDFSAVSEPGAFDQAQHSVVVEVGVNTKCPDSLFECQRLCAVEEFRRYASSPLSVCDGQAVYQYVRFIGCLLYTSDAADD